MTAKRLLSLVLLASSFLLSGCAAMLYSDRFGTLPAVPVKSAQPAYLTARRIDTEDADQDGMAQLLFQLTPIGILAPLFGYPAMDHSYSQTVTLQIQPPEATTRTGSSHEFHVPPEGESEKWVLDFDTGAVETMRETGRVVAYKPRFLTITVRCDKRSCSASADPPIVAADGSVHLEAHEFKDTARLKEIADEERIRLEKQRWVGKENDAITFVARFPRRTDHETIGEALASLYNGLNKIVHDVNQSLPSVATPMTPYDLRCSAYQITGPLYRVTCVGSSKDVYDREIHDEYQYEVNLERQTIKPINLKAWITIGGDAVARRLYRRLKEEGKLSESLNSNASAFLDSDVSSFAPTYSLRRAGAR